MKRESFLKGLSYLFFIGGDICLYDDKKEIINKVEKVYRQVKWHQDSFMARFCCDFKLLESKCDDYNLKKYGLTDTLVTC